MLWWVGIGVTAYGAAYLFVHEVYIHHRLPVPVPRWRYLEWLRESHRAHHLTGAEPYGMLLPLRRAEARQQSPHATSSSARSEPRLDHLDVKAGRRGGSATRWARWRL